MRSNHRLITDSPFADRIIGSNDHEMIEIGEGRDTVHAGGGNDVIWDMDGAPTTATGLSRRLSASDDNIDGGAGSDLIYGGFGADRINGGDGFDTLDYRYSLSAVTLDLRTGIGGGDVNSASRGDIVTSIEQVSGSRLADTLTGSDGLCVLNGEGGHDTLIGGRGETRMFGGAGNDVFVVNSLYNTASGGEGIDMVDFSNMAHGISINGIPQRYLMGVPLPADDIPEGALRFGLNSDIERVVGSRHSDFIRMDPFGNGTGVFVDGGEGDDVIFGEWGDDRLLGGSGNDRLTGDLGSDILEGGDGDDRLNGGPQNDVLRGGSGNDVLKGGYHDDVLHGGDGNDRLHGGSETDTLTGGAGSDVFEFKLYDGPGRDTITDFEQGSDRIDLSDLAGRSNVESQNMLRFIDGGQAAELGYGSVWSRVQGKDTLVEIDINGDRESDMSFTMTGRHDLTADDFILGTISMISMQASADFFF